MPFSPLSQTEIEVAIANLVAQLGKLNQQQAETRRFLVKVGKILLKLQDKYATQAEFQELREQVIKLAASLTSDENLPNLAGEESLNSKASFQESGIDSPGKDIAFSLEQHPQIAFNLQKLLAEYREGNRDFVEIDLSGASLQGDFSQINLSRAKLIRANLRKTNLREANLQGADLSYSDLCGVDLGSAQLYETNFQKAIYNSETIFPVDFSPKKAGAYLIEPKTFIRNADLTKMNLEGMDLSQSSFQSSKLADSNLSYCKFIQTSFQFTDLSRVNLAYANFTAADLSGAVLLGTDLSKTDFTAANLSRANLKLVKKIRGAILNGVILTGADLSGLALNYLKLRGANLFRANLCASDLTQADLSEANLKEADLRGTNLFQANLAKADLTNAHLAGANLQEANLTGAIMPDGTVHE